MAGGKLTPRQKMINLMYLVFIAMLALNMSKEVLTAFGLMNEKFESANKSASENNSAMLGLLQQKASEDQHYVEAASNAKKVANISKEFYDYLETLKADATKGYQKEASKKDTIKKFNYEAMDKSASIDESWFNGEKYSPKGDEIIAHFKKYVADMKVTIGNDTKLKSIFSEVASKFATDDEVDREGKSIKYLDYHFKTYPAIASLAKLNSMQNDVKKIEADVFNALLGKAAIDITKISNYQAIVVLDKNVVFSGEQVTGKVVLGRYDESTVPTSFQGPGKIVNGQAIINLTAGGIGEQQIKGKFTFTEDNKTIPLDFSGKYVVVPRPNSATVSADKMNVVYRGVPNPMSISFAGISDSDVKASAPGLTRVGNGKYNLTPGAGNQVVVTVSGKLPDGRVVSDSKVYRIKNLPSSEGAFGGETESASGSLNRLGTATLSAKFPSDFDYDLRLDVTRFSFKVPGRASIDVVGNRLNAECQRLIANLGSGTIVKFSNIKTKVVGSDATGSASSVTYEIR